jgi:hypothetical protein
MGSSSRWGDSRLSEGRIDPESGERSGCRPEHFLEQDPECIEGLWQPMNQSVRPDLFLDGVRVLVIDDHAVVREVITAELLEDLEPR